MKFYKAFLNPYIIVSLFIWGALLLYDFKVVYNQFEYQKNINFNIIESKIIENNEKYLQALQLMSKAYQNYIPTNYFKDKLKENLKYNSKLKIYDSNGFDKLNFGSLTYIGSEPNSEKLMQMERSLSISFLYQEVKKLFPRSPWVYFSTNDFIYIYPFVNSEEYKYTPETPDMQFIKLSRPEINPDKKPYWTDPYVDEAGKGLMTTISLPVYLKDKYQGAFSIDFILTDLKSVFQNVNFDTGEYLLLNNKGFLLTATDLSLINNKVQVPICTEAELANYFNKSFSFIKNKQIYFAYHTELSNIFIVHRTPLVKHYLSLISHMQLSLYVTIVIVLINIGLFYYASLQRKLNADDVQKNKLMSLAEMSAGIAHEINNPLTVIRGRTEQLIRSLNNGEMDHAYYLASLERVINSSDRISKIVKALKNFSREGRTDPFVKSNLRNLIDDALILCENRIRNNDANLTVGEVPDIEINCRPYQIVQVLINVINNSYDAIEPNQDKWIKLVFTHYSNKVSIRIIDSGTGINKDIVKKMFDPFFTSKEINRGTGLGLSISKRIIIEHGGNLYYDLYNNANTSFVIELPINS